MGKRSYIWLKTSILKVYTTKSEYTYMHDLQAIYNKVRQILMTEVKEYFTFDENTRFYPRLPSMSDLEVISLSIASECLEIHSENLLWSKIKKDYPTMIGKLGHLTKFNKRRKTLLPITSFCLEKLSNVLHDHLGDETLIIDSMPIPVCKLSREHSSRVCRNITTDEVVADKGYNIAMGGYYIGYKFHLIVSKSGVYKDMIITSASVHDSYFLKILNAEDEHLSSREMLGDRGYIGKVVQLKLFEDLSLELKIPYRRNQKDFKIYPYMNKIIRKKIEVIFSQYCDEFRIKENYAKSFSGIYCRIVTKVLAKTFKQYINLLNGKPINQTKHALAA